MKKLLMTAALLVVGATAFGASAPVSVSLDVVKTSQLVIMDNGQQLNQINLSHPQILLSAAAKATQPSVATQNFTAQTGDGNKIQVNSTDATSIQYTLEGVGTGGALTLTNGPTNTLESILSLAKASDTLTTGASSGTANAITSTISPDALNALTKEGTYTGTATLKVTAAS